MSDTTRTSESVRANKVTLAGMRLGAQLILPLIPGVAIFAAAYGAAASQKGMSVAEALLASALVFAGAAQLVALEVWTQNWTFPTMLAVSVVTFTVNSRLILQGASLQPWLQPLPGKVLWPTLFIFTDANWVMAERYRVRNGDDAGVLIGSGLLLWFVWVIFTAPGAILGGLMADPRRWGVDLVMPVFFIAMSVPLWKGRRDTVTWSVAGLVSVSVWWLVPGYSFLIAGPIAGACTGALLGYLDRE